MPLVSQKKETGAASSRPSHSETEVTTMRVVQVPEGPKKQAPGKEPS